MTSPRGRQISSADLVGAHDDLTVEILLRLPAKYAARLKLVSKRWLSLISDRYFIRRHCLLNSDAISPPIGLILLEINRSNPRFTFVSLDESKNETTTEEKPTRYIQCFDPHAPAPIKISNSSNGLLLCYSRTPLNATQCKLYIVNPTTHQFTTLPEPPVEASNWKNFNLAYDPCKSPVYRVYGVELSNSDSISNIHEYSSDSGVWRLFSAHHSKLDPIIRNFNGVFCNGAIHWVCIGGCCYRFNVDQNSIKRLPKPPLPEYWNGDTDLKYFGECQGNLNFIALDKGISTIFVYELHKDCSGWFVKYSLDEKDISAAFPEISDHQRPLPLGIPQHRQYKFCSVLSYVGVKNEEPKLVISIPGKIISYSFKDNTFNKIHDFHDEFAKYKAFNFNGTWSCI